MNEEEFEDMLGLKYGWPEPIGMPRRPIILPLVIWIAMLGCLAWLVLSISGCADAPKVNEPKVCYLKLLGNTEEGFSVVLQQCVTPEEFKAAQK